MSSAGDEPTGRADWLLQYIVPPWTGRMDALLLDAPQGRCLLTLLLGAASLGPGQVGHIRIEVRGQPAENAPLIASFDLTTEGDFYIEHTFDLVFVSETTPPTCWPAMILEPGSGLDYIRFHSLTLGLANPVLEP